MKEDLKKGMITLKQTNSLLLMMAWLNVNLLSLLLLAPLILAALTALDSSGERMGMKVMTLMPLRTYAVVLLRHANFMLNVWRQKHFSEFPTEVGKRTQREGIPADKHLFPDKFRAKIKSDHDHS